MKIFCLILTLTFIIPLSNAQTKSQQTYKKIIEDASGNRIDYLTYYDLISTGNWIAVETKNKEGIVTHVKLRKSTQEEKEELIISTTSGEKSDLIGEKAPKFRLRDLNGQLISSANTKGKVVVMNFWFVWCKPCVLEMPEMNGVYQQYKNNSDVIFVAITFNKKELVKKFLTKHELEYSVIADAKEVFNTFNPYNSAPINLVIGKDGYYKDYIVGGIHGHGLSKTIQNALSGGD